MSARQRVGFVINLDRTWLGGINYFRNLITAIYDDPQRTIDAVFFVGEQADLGPLKGLPAVETVRTSLLDPGTPRATLRKVFLRLAKRDVLLDRLLARHRIDVLSHSGVLGPRSRTPVACWIADFQHVHLPTHFTDSEREERNRWFERVCTTSKVVIVSSENAQADLVSLFPEMKGRSEVLRFVPDLDVSEPLPGLAELEARHGFRAPYVYLPNQYWAHKNHRVVIEALGLLKQAGRDVTVVSTGNPVDYRNPDHYRALERRITELGVDDHYVRLGVVPYRDLLALIRHAVCLVNPSFFEGWSTTVEEARAMDRFIILSDIGVHREQAPPRSRFFDPNDAAALADALWDQWQAAARTSGTASEPAGAGLERGHVDRRRAFSRRYHDIIGAAIGRGASSVSAG